MRRQALIAVLLLAFAVGTASAQEIAMTWAYSPSYGKPLSVPQGPPMKSRAPIVLALLVLFGAAAVTVFWIRRPTDTSSSSGGPPAVTATTAATPITPTFAGRSVRAA